MSPERGLSVLGWLTGNQVSPNIQYCARFHPGTGQAHTHIHAHILLSPVGRLTAVVYCSLFML